jgi:hypothetical protein
MHQTTVRFSSDLWEAVESECKRLGVSAAQYLREAALARLTYTAAKRGDIAYDVALESAGVAAGSPAQPFSQETSAATQDALENELAATAVTAQAHQVLRRAQEIRARSGELRRERKARHGGN